MKLTRFQQDFIKDAQVVAGRATKQNMTYNCLDDVTTRCTGVSGDVVTNAYGEPHIIALAADGSDFGARRARTPRVFDVVISKAYTKQQSGAL